MDNSQSKKSSNKSVVGIIIGIILLIISYFFYEKALNSFNSLNFEDSIMSYITLRFLFNFILPVIIFFVGVLIITISIIFWIKNKPKSLKENKLEKNRIFFSIIVLFIILIIVIGIVLSFKLIPLISEYYY